MELTIERALSLLLPDKAAVKAGHAGKCRLVHAVKQLESLKCCDQTCENQLLLAEFGLFDDPLLQLEAVIDSFVEQHCAGLGIRVDSGSWTIPQQLLQQADKTGFPVIALPSQYTMADTMGKFTTMMAEQRNEWLQSLLQKQSLLMQLVMQGKPIRQLFAAVSDIVGYPLAIFGSRGQLVYNASSVPDAELHADWPWPFERIWLEAASWQAYCVPLLKRSRCTGFVLFFLPRQQLAAIGESFYGQVAELIAYQMNMNYEDYFELSAQQDLGLMIKRHLKNGLPVGAVTDYADRWEIELFAGGFRCALTDYPMLKDESARVEKLERLKLEYLSHNRLQQLLGIHIVLEEGVLSLFPDNGRDDGEQLQSALSSCFSGLKSGQQHSPKATVSSRKKQAKQLREAFGECRETQRLSAAWGMGEQVVKHDTLDLAFVFEQISEERMQTFCKRWLGSLLIKDTNVQEMLRTLETYLACDGQLNETARRLFIHRNTATYRIEKLSEMLDVDFKKVDDLMRLKLAFLFRSMLNRGSLTAEEML